MSWIVIWIFRQWQIQGKDRGARPSLFVDQNEARRAEKMFFGDRLAPTPTALSQGLGQALLGG